MDGGRGPLSLCFGWLSVAHKRGALSASSSDDRLVDSVRNYLFHLVEQ